jgi:hypothetical protein
MMFMGTGFITSARNTPVADASHSSQTFVHPLAEGIDTRQSQALAYARRSSELARLRDLGSAPLATWVAAPAGDSASRPSASAPACTMPNWQAGAVVSAAATENDNFPTGATAPARFGGPEAADLRDQMRTATLPHAERSPESAAAGDAIEGDIPMPLARPKSFARRIFWRRPARPPLYTPRTIQPDYGPFGWLFGIGPDGKPKTSPPQQRVVGTINAGNNRATSTQ